MIPIASTVETEATHIPVWLGTPVGQIYVANLTPASTATRAPVIHPVTFLTGPVTGLISSPSARNSTLAVRRLTKLLIADVMV
jgi:hypothetical protein